MTVRFDFDVNQHRWVCRIEDKKYRGFGGLIEFVYTYRYMHEKKNNDFDNDKKRLLAAERYMESAAIRMINW